MPISRGVLPCKMASACVKRCPNSEVSSSAILRALFLCDGEYMHSLSWSYDIEYNSASSPHKPCFDSRCSSYIFSHQYLIIIQYGTTAKKWHRTEQDDLHLTFFPRQEVPAFTTLGGYVTCWLIAAFLERSSVLS